jgi:hypothetical protein
MNGADTKAEVKTSGSGGRASCARTKRSPSIRLRFVSSRVRLVGGAQHQQQKQRLVPEAQRRRPEQQQPEQRAAGPQRPELKPLSRTFFKCGVLFMTMDAHLTLEAVFDAYFDCRRTKRNSINQLRFEADLESNLVGLYRDLTGGYYRIGRSIAFVVTHPKPGRAPPHL